ncbi:MAG: hypothetical protein HF981_07360 [Desulfobacteraceae bacterium]|nr:hypothetical protein [Desulfobacteraceae bacterium]MBC2750186.1 hypothetical protein [Desulfobacteraceae bacterium]
MVMVMVYLNIAPNKPPKIPVTMDPMMNKIIIAGIDAIAHLTISTTMEPNGILISEMETLEPPLVFCSIAQILSFKVSSLSNSLLTTAFMAAPLLG